MEKDVEVSIEDFSSITVKQRVILLAFSLYMILFGVSFYRFPITYWLEYVKRAPTEFGITFLHLELLRLVLGEVYLLLILVGAMLYLKGRKLGVILVGLGILFETGVISLIVPYFVTSVEPYGLYIICMMFLAPAVLLSLIFFAVRKPSAGILYSLTTIPLAPISLNIAEWSLSGYTGTGGGLFFAAILFSLGWVLILIGGIPRFKVGVIPLALGALMVWSPYGIGLIPLSLAYALRVEKPSKGLYASLFIMVVGFLASIYWVLKAPPLR